MQAGRTLPEYRAVRQKRRLQGPLMNPDRAGGDPTHRRVRVDAAILFSDILVVPEAMGSVQVEKVGPGSRNDSFVHLDRSEVDRAIKYVLDAVRHPRAHGRVPSSAGALTIFCYMVEEGSKIGPRRRMLSEPGCRCLLAAITQATYCTPRRRVRLFDSWAVSESTCSALPHAGSARRLKPVHGVRQGGSHFDDLPPCRHHVDWQTDRRWARDSPTWRTQICKATSTPACSNIIRGDHRMIDELGIQRPSLTWATVCTPTSLPTGRAFVQAVKEYVPATERETTTSA